jgi:hypothetical protein
MNLLESEEGEGPPPAWVHVYGQVSAQSGMRDMFIVNLTPGNYGLISFGEAEEGPPDAAQGSTHPYPVWPMKQWEAHSCSIAPTATHLTCYACGPCMFMKGLFGVLPW